MIQTWLTPSRASAAAHALFTSALQVDARLGVRAELEQACQQRGLRLFVLPPSSPRLNGWVERAQRTHSEEFYQV